MKLTLRGHHLLCLKGFQGYGYDENFVRNMSEVNFKRKDNTTTVSLTLKTDDLCRHCPNLKNEFCENELHDEKIRNMDKEVLKKLDYSDEYDSIELFEKVDEIFNTQESVSKICFNCIWHEKCLFYQKLSKNR